MIEENSDIQEVHLAEGANPELANAHSYGLLYWISWLMILSIVLAISAFVGYSQFYTPKSFETSAVEMMQFNLMSKMSLGFNYPDEQRLSNLNQLRDGPLEQRLAHAIMLQEILGPAKALERLQEIDDAVEQEQARLRESSAGTKPPEFPTESQLRIRQLVGEMFQRYANDDFANTELQEEDRQLLASKFGWVGQLSMTPKKSPDKKLRRELEDEGTRTFMAAILVFALGALMILAAFVALALIFGMMMLDQILARYRNSGKHAQIYLETFAIWIVSFFGLQLLLGLIGSLIGDTTTSMALTLVAFFGSLLVLIWPVHRGIPFAQVCKDIGWEWRNPIEEVVVGCFSYLALLIPMIVGLTITAVLGSGLALLDTSSEFQSVGPVGHPIAEEIASGNLVSWVFIFLSACVAAPIVEETMFRGVLYRSLRETSGRRSPIWLSISFSAVFGGLIFAMVHPQGIIGVPVLTTLAIGFSLVREWRSSLIGPMVMHALNNSAVTCIMLLLFT